MLSIKKIIFSSLIAATSFVGLEAEAMSGKRIKISKNDVYLMMLYSRQQDAPFTGAIFCPVAKGKVQDCRKKSGGFIFGMYRWDIGTSWFARDRKAGLPYALFDNVRFKGEGQYVLTSGTFGDVKIIPEDITYSFNSKPGTVFVIPETGQSAGQAIKTAQTLLRSEYGDAVDQLKIRLIDAVKYDCEGSGLDKICKPGAAVSPSALHKNW
ncbi:hypothetical protein [Leisingera sp. M523]|uniref:hypothetical protein n=1 Tax=Leisingera sp. M523 TaxID=2867013 RepID=UPI0021A8E84C|nr:hypothetical protein [Leisingera sp. M523]UWQ29993.1 hypothetical protein K3557_05455 [Leisingera sp. M523]